MARIKYQRPFGGDAIKLTQHIQTAIQQASGVPEPPLTLLTGRWGTLLTNTFSLVFAGRPSQDLVLKYRGVIGHFFDTTFQLIPSKGFTKMMIFGVPCIRRNGGLAPPHVLLHELSLNVAVQGSIIVDGPYWSQAAQEDPSLETSYCSFILIDPTGKKAKEMSRARNCMFAKPVKVKPAFVVTPYRQCKKCHLLNHATEECDKPTNYIRCAICGQVGHVANEHATKCASRARHSTIKCNCPPRCFNCARNKLTKLDHYAADACCPLKKRMHTPTPK